MHLFLISSVLDIVKNRRNPKFVVTRQGLLTYKNTCYSNKINDKEFTATIYDNETSAALKSRLPLTLDMNELNGNEKYFYLQDSLPTNTERVGTINAGDIMLYGSDCIVLFYKSFDTPYSYTRIGHIDDTSGLAEAVGVGNVTVTFE